MAQWTAKADPTKDFFIDMITRDIGLDECIFDLLDNSIDGASRHAQRHDRSNLSGYFVDVQLSDSEFAIKDNCGGMSLVDATEYAFHFGRRSTAPKDAENSIGLYGIGMKRAIFKIGRQIQIKSATTDTPDEAFVMTIDVAAWAAKKEWEFPLEHFEPEGFVGTEIIVSELRPATSSEFSDQIFINNMRKDVGKYYSFFLQSGFEIKINGVSVKQHVYGVRDGEDISPYVHEYVDAETGVQVRIISGVAGTPPEDSGDPSTLTKDTESWGWYVVCNDRVVLAGDKTEKTIWGDGFPTWHPQYNGFMGLIFFSSENPGELPWTTTKRQIDETLPVFRRATSFMRDATRKYLDYTNTRKANLEQAKSAESSAAIKPIAQIEARSAAPALMKLPTFDTAPKIRMGTISYQQPLTLLNKVAQSFGNSQMSYKQIGQKTFEYYLENEVGE
ncbi:ATP-binding protein [Pseudomonas sp. CFBP 8772]|uniref:ATP-binding protein n=1 Tax=Pseudomonas sp. CFBP 8772 TaxID=2775284 RepID=UPI00177B2803|nr:ATP-binding protein [Pseudomonas sp. CFBP 8772]MBD8597086.1 ATP-binding protein [Pseudomonas sp. CFBP 8772]